MNDDDINKLVMRLTKVVPTKDDLRNFATKDDLKNFATKDDLKRLATKEDLKGLVTKGEFNKGLNELKSEIKSVGQVLSDFTDAIDEKLENHEKRLKKIEAIPSIAHQIK